MGTTAYSSGRSKRIYTNYPFRKGMVFEDLISGEYQCKSVINYDYTNAGDYVFPRPAFVNALLHNGVTPVKLPESSVVMATNMGPKYLISTDTWVSKNDFVNDVVGVTPEIKGTYGLHLTKLEQDLSNYETTRGVKEVILVNVVNNAVITVKDTEEGNPYLVKLIGVSTLPGDNYYYTLARVLMIDYTLGKTLRLVYDPVAPEEIDDHVPAYLFANDMLVNYLMLYKGYSYLENINDNYLFYDELREAYYAAVTAGYSIHGDITPLVNAQIESYYASSVLANSGFILSESEGPTKELYFKQSVVEQTNIDTVIYDTKTYVEAVLSATDLLTPIAGDTYIQMLRNDYTKNSYNQTVNYFEYPHVNHAWRNALSFIGRIVIEGQVAYKGLITIQANQTELFRIILVKPASLNPLLWNLEDPTSTALNAYEDIVVFNDEVFTDASMYFRNPTMSTTLIYNDYPREGVEVSILKRFNRQQKCFVKPYVLIPEMALSGFQKAQMRFKYKIDQDEEEGWEDLIVLADSVEGLATKNEVKILNSTGELAYLKNTIYLLNGTFTYVPSTFTAWNAQTTKYTQTKSNPYILDPSAYSIGTIIECGDTYKTYYRVAYNRSVKDLSELNARSLEVEIRTVYNPGVTVQATSNPLNLVYNISSTEKNLSIEGVYNFTFANGVTLVKDGIDTIEREYLDITLDHDSNVYVKRFLGTHWSVLNERYEFNTTDILTTYYNSVTFSLTYKATMTSAAAVTSFFVSSNYEEALTVMPSQLIYLTGEEVLKTTILSEHNIYNATNVVQLDRYVILYGEHIGSNCLQFLEYDNFSIAPFPYGQIIFDRAIIHVHVHRGSLYVFCEDGIWIMHKGFGYQDMIKTFAYAGIKLHPTEKGTVQSLGNNVFVLNNNRCFVIRTNINIQDASDIYTIPISNAVNQIIEDPRIFLKERLQYGYSQVIDDTKPLTTYYKTFIDNQEIYLTASYYLKDPLQKLMVSYIYNNETGRWKIYDTLAASIPIESISSNNSKGFDYLCVNDVNDGCPTLATFLYEIPVNNLYDYSLGDAMGLIKDAQGEWKLASAVNGVDHPFVPIACEFDTGSLDMNSMHKKKVRRFYINIINIDGESLEFKAIPYIDGVPELDNISVEALLNAVGDLTEDFDLNTELVVPLVFKFISPSVGLIEGYTLPESYFTTRSRLILDIRTNLLGKIPGLKLLVPTTSRYHITHYAIVYRQQMAR